jgi:hypothetical protein
VCFSDHGYEDAAAQSCLSDLLAIGFHRFIIDLYWDQSRQTWSLCPVELSSEGNSTSPIRNGTYPTTLSTASSSATANNPSNLVIASSSGTAATQTAAAAQPSQTRHQIGPYSCTQSIGISTLTNVLADYFKATENDVDATFKYIEFNLHLAAPFHNPTGNTTWSDPSRLPTLGNYISNLINSTLSPYLYTPAALHSDRANLNQSWFSAPADSQPLSEYFTVQPLENGSGLYTLDGWPSTSIIMLQRALRIIVGIGSIDERMKQYDWAADADSVFATGYISRPVDSTLSSNGLVPTECFYQANNTSLSATNSSWAISSTPLNTTTLETPPYAAVNLSACGISPILNTTLQNSTVSDNLTMYRAYLRSSIWGWADGEPSGKGMAKESGNQHCAVANPLNSGRWQVTDCTQEHYCMCRSKTSPFVFSVSDNRIRYYQGDKACDGNREFAVPRTALESHYMNTAITNWTFRQDADDDAANEVFWLNLNDIDIRDCWVSGVNQTCPYQAAARNQKGTVVIPVVAGVIVFLLAILSFTVKCAANRQNTRRRLKRGEDGWDYEGVPS